MAAIVLGLASSLAWGFADFFGGIQSRRRPLLAVLVVTLTAGFALTVVGVLLDGEGPPAGVAWIGWALMSSLFGIGGLACFYRGLATGNMGVVAPISSAAAVIPLAVGLAQGERPSGVQFAGVALAITGVVLASREKDLEAPGGRRVAAGVWLAIGAAVGFGGFFVAMDRASDGDPYWAIMVGRIASVIALSVAVAITRTDVPRRARDLRVLVPIGLLDTGANLLYALATTKGLLSIVGVLGSVYPVVTIMLAHFVLHERLHALQRLGAVGALAGAALISSAV
jgi:drug/metabolite transporter (DMT)-like permease